MNEDALMEVLATRGFELVRLAGLSLTEQVELFQQAECVVDHHGAGHTNALFCSPGAALVEIFQDGHFAPPFARRAQINAMRYGYAVGRAEGVDTISDVASLGELLDRMEVT